ncbi:MAG: hypothetical protein ACOX69_10600, partial [Coriobacteriales bacterium]
KVKDIESLERDEYWNAFARSDYLPSMCLGCEKETICDGGCREAAHIYNGSISAVDPLMNDCCHSQIHTLL